MKPKSEDPNRGEREDFKIFKKICKENNISLDVINFNNDKITDFPNCDILIEVSWRYLIPQTIVKKAKILSFGIHRGKLPDFAGAEPIKQALLKGEKEIVLSAHNLDSIIDAGSTLNSISLPVKYDESISLDENIQKILDEITPFFSKLFFKTVDPLF